ncbi:MAG TPA: lipopolysaccharide heptosyltransferase II, partial [Pyrinomonadaceae bacterium]|nr:lipopolysaccharide heptosyltransferase II [Pyrinomonadaceae bacterium]
VVIPAWKDTRHEVFYYRELIKAVESCLVGTSMVYDTEPNSSLAVSSTRKDEAREFLRQQGIDFSRPVIAVGAGSTNSVAKRWPAERFARVAELLQREFDANIILLGSGGDKIVSDEVANLLIFKPIDLTGKTSIADAVSILSVANLLISNDIGLAHVAPAVGTRTVVIFGPTNPVTTRPFSPLAEVVRHEVECSPCMLRECPIDHRCMTRVTVEQVFDVAKSLLGKNDEN